MKIQMRPWRFDDLQAMLLHANNFNIAKNMTDRFPHPYTFEHAKTFLNKVTSDNPVQVLAITLNDEPIGASGLFPQDDIFSKNAELGYWLSEQHWGKGYATDAIRWMVDYGFKTFPINRIFARPFGTNIASQRVLEKSGFTLEATFIGTIFKNGKYFDELVYAIRKS